MTRVAEETWRARVHGCLLGGAIGDALGGPVEFQDGRSIVADHPDGVRDFSSGAWPPGTITDDTQMTLFTMEGLIRASVRTDRGLGFTVAVVQHAYDRWLDTQTLSGPSGERDGWLQAEQWLYARRAPGNTCLSALTEARKGESRIPQFGAEAVNDSKGCGGVMRVAPFGLLPARYPTDWVFDSAATAAGYTHGHPTGKLAYPSPSSSWTLSRWRPRTPATATPPEQSAATSWARPARRDGPAPRARLHDRGPSCHAPAGRRLRARVRHRGPLAWRLRPTHHLDLPLPRLVMTIRYKAAPMERPAAPLPARQPA